MKFRTGDIIRHRCGAVCEAIADEAQGKVLVLVDGRLHTFSRLEIVDPPPPSATAAVDTELEEPELRETAAIPVLRIKPPDA